MGDFVLVFFFGICAEQELDTGKETFRWLLPRYEAYIHQSVGEAVMKKGLTVRSATVDERKSIAALASKGFDEQLEKACGKELATKMRALFAKYRP